MNKFIFLEEKDLPKAPFMVMVVTKDGRELPYCVKIVRRGNISSATMLLGEFIPDLIKNPSRIFNLDLTSTAHQRLYIANETEKGYHKGVKCYRKILPGDLTKWRIKILPLAIRSNYHRDPDTAGIKTRFMELSKLL